VKGSLAATGNNGGSKRRCRGLYRSSNERQGGAEERTSEPYRRAKPVRGFSNNTENMRKRRRSRLLACDTRGHDADDGAVRLWMTSAFESAAHDGRYSVVACDGLAKVECSAKSGTRRNEKGGAPGGNTSEFAFPQDMRNRLTALAAGTSASVQYRAQRERTSVSEDAAAEESSSVIANGHDHRALLIVELSEPKELDVTCLRVHRGRRSVLCAHNMQIVHVQHEVALRSLGVVANRSMARGFTGPGKRGGVAGKERLGNRVHRRLG